MPLFWETITMRGSQGLDFNKIPLERGVEFRPWDNGVGDIAKAHWESFHGLLILFRIS